MFGPDGKEVLRAVPGTLDLARTAVVTATTAPRRRSSYGHHWSFCS